MAREYIGAGWRKQTKGGIDCISLKINEDANVRNGENLVLYKTREKKSDASPDFNLCRESRDDAPQGNQGRPQGNRQGGYQGGGNRQNDGGNRQGGYPNQQGSYTPDRQGGSYTPRQGNGGNRQGGNGGNRPQQQNNRQDFDPGEDFDPDHVPF